MSFRCARECPNDTHWNDTHSKDGRCLEGGPLGRGQPLALGQRDHEAQIASVIA